MIKIECEMEAEVVTTLIAHLDLILPTYRKLPQRAKTVSRLEEARDCLLRSLGQHGLNMPRMG